MPTRTFTLKIPIQVTGATAAKAAITGIVGSAGQAANAKRGASRAAIDYGKSLDGLRGKLVHTRTTMLALRSVLTGMGIAAFGKGILDAGIKMETISSAMRFATGSAAGARAELGFLRQETQRLGLEFSTSAERYSKLASALKGTGVDVRELFSAMGEAAAVLGLNALQTERSFFALEQMAGKGVVSMEELRRQLGENLVGAFGIASRAMGMSVGEMNKFVASGKLLAKDFLPKFAAQLRKEMAQELPTSLDKTVQHLNRLKNAVFETFLDISNKVSPAVKQFVKDLTDGIGSVDTGSIARGLSAGLDTLSDALGFATRNADDLGIAIKALIAMNVAKWASNAATALRLAGTAAGLFGIAIGLGTAAWLKLQNMGADKSQFNGMIAGARETETALTELFSKIAELGDKAPRELQDSFAATRQSLLVQIQEMTRDLNAEMSSKFVKMSDLDGPLGALQPKKWHEARQAILELTATFNDLSVVAKNTGETIDDEVTPPMDKLLEKLKEQRDGLKLLVETMRKGGELDFVEFALSVGLTADEIRKATGAKHDLAVEIDQLRKELQAEEDDIKAQEEAYKKATEALKEFDEKMTEHVDHLRERVRAQNELNTEQATADAKRLLALADIAQYGEGGKELAEIEAMEAAYNRFAKSLESKFGPQGAQRILKDFKRQKLEAMGIEPLRDQWIAAARTMADAFGEAFGEMGDQVSQFINGIFQIIALMEQMGKLLEGIMASRAVSGGGAGAAGGAGGAGALGWIKGLFGGGAGAAAGGAAAGFVGPPTAAQAYFAPWGAKAGGAAATAGGGGGAGFAAIGGGALAGLGIGAGIGAIGQMISPNSYAQIGGTIGGAIGGAIGVWLAGPAGAKIGSVIGGVIGTTIGGLIKKGVTTAVAQIGGENGKIGFVISEGKSKVGKELARVAGEVIEGAVEFANSIGATGFKPGAIGLKLRKGQYSVFGGGEAFRSNDREKAIEEATFRAIKHGGFEGLGEQIVKAIHSGASDNLENLRHGVEVALAIESLGVPQFQAGIRTVITTLDALRREGIRYGLDVSKVNAEVARVLGATRDEILGITKSEYERRIEQAQQFNDEIAAARAKAQAEVEGIIAELTAAQAVTTVANDDVLEQMGKFGLGVAGVAVVAGASVTEIQARLAAAQGFLDALPDLIDPALIVDEEAKKAKEDKQKKAQEERKRRQEERQQKIESAMGNISTPLEATRQKFQKLGEDIAFLKKMAAEGAVEIDHLNLMLAEMAQQVTLDFGKNLIGFLDEYYGKTKEHEAIRLKLENLNFVIRLKMLQLEYNELVRLGLLSTEFMADFQTILDYFETHPPTFGGITDPTKTEALAPKTPVEEFIERLAEAANDPFFSAKSGIFGLLDKLYSYLPEGTMVQAPRIEGGRWVQRPGSGGGTRPTIPGSGLGAPPPIPDPWFSGGVVTSPGMDWDPFRVVMGEMMTVEEARFEVAKAIQLLELEVLRAQLEAAGLWSPAMQGLHKMATAAVTASQYVADNFDLIKTISDDMLERWRTAGETFADLWESVQPQEDLDAVEAIKRQYKELRSAFTAQSVEQRVAFLKDQGLGADVFKNPVQFPGSPTSYKQTDGTIFTTQEMMERFESIIGPMEAEAIAKAIADEVGDILAPIRDYFDDLRTQGAQLTTREQYENTLRAFNEAFAAGKIDRAVEMARLLTGEVGIAQFGTSGQAFQDLTDFLVSTLGSLLPEGPPADLMTRGVNAQERTVSLVEQFSKQSHTDSLLLIAAVKENTAAINRQGHRTMVEAGSVSR